MSLNYTTAARLKEKGFPQRIKKGDYFFNEYRERAIWLEIEDLAFVFPKLPAIKCPTLEELIAECGDRFNSLRLNVNPRWKKWVAFANGLTPMTSTQPTALDMGGYDADTPSEAVSALWEALQDNKE